MNLGPDIVKVLYCDV